MIVKVMMMMDCLVVMTESARSCDVFWVCVEGDGVRSKVTRIGQAGLKILSLSRSSSLFRRPPSFVFFSFFTVRL
jgi:hypothetical protein